MTSSQTIVLFLILLSYLKSLNMLLNLDLLNILLTISSIPTNLLTLSNTPLKLLCGTFTIILLMSQAHTKYLVFVFADLAQWLKSTYRESKVISQVNRLQTWYGAGLLIQAENDWRGVRRPRIATHRNCHLFYVYFSLFSPCKRFSYEMK